MVGCCEKDNYYRRFEPKGKEINADRRPPSHSTTSISVVDKQTFKRAFAGRCEWTGKGVLYCFCIEVGLALQGKYKG